MAFHCGRSSKRLCPPPRRRSRLSVNYPQRMRPTLRRLLRVFIFATYYPSLWFSRLMNLLGRWNWWDAVDEHVFVGAVPSIPDLRRLRALGVGAIVNMCDEFRGHEAALA